MRILYVAMADDYGDPARGVSFEQANFYDSLVRMGHEVIPFDFMALTQSTGRNQMNQRLWETVRAVRPALLFAVPFGWELDPAMIARISVDTVTLAWFCDDHWRFDDFTRYLAPAFTWSATTATSALPKYERIGYRNVIHTQWACNHFSYRKLDLPLIHEVTFIGQPHGDRRRVIDRLRRAGLEVKVWGYGWESGRLSQEEMIRTFNQSRINLNLSNASVVSLRHALLPWTRPHDQIKGRNFEIPGCGGFELSGVADNLGDYFDIGREIVCFGSTGDLIDKIRYYLAHEDERRAIAEAGYKRTLAEHTYEKRFGEMFERIGVHSYVTPAETGGVASGSHSPSM
ncbi:MAG TPA: glycosyltransferase [Nitrospiria bacterium]|nr:glycosyltransferase [Nitrospiria bacterium]